MNRDEQIKKIADLLIDSREGDDISYTQAKIFATHLVNNNVEIKK